MIDFSQIQTLTVSELNQKVKNSLETQYPFIALVGEVSNLSRPSSGHAYFTLKDQHAQIRCAYFKTYQRTYKLPLQDGMQVRALGKLSLFEPRGDYQFIIQNVEEMGTGTLYKQFETLKKKLALEGLFDFQHKKTLPRFPTSIAVITSSKSAALRDILITLYKRFPLAEIVLYPSEVQGQTAPNQLIKALDQACQENKAQVIILARGGGSLEDLWAFNDENLARALFKATIPIVTGIGHETDFTIADFIADHRAATPTAAAMAITPDKLELNQQLRQHEARLIFSLTQRFLTQRNQLLALTNQLKNRIPKLTQQTQTVDYLEQQLNQAMKWVIHAKYLQIHPLHNTLLHTQLLPKIQGLQHHGEKLSIQLRASMQQLLTQSNQKLGLHAHSLNSLSPLETLNRGYAIAMQDGKILTSVDEVTSAREVEVRLAKGLLKCMPA